MRVLIGIALAVALAANAKAGCDEPVSDEVGALPGIIQQVQDATNRLGNAASADVRVRVFNGLHGATNLDALKDQLVASCPTWHASNGTIRSSMIMLFHAPGQKPDIGFYYGISSQPKLSGNWQAVLRDKLVPAVTAYKNGEKTALGPGLVSTLDGLSALFLRPAAAAGPTTIINNAASDHSAFWSFLKWVLIIGGGSGVVYLGYLVVTATQTRSRNMRSAQTDARRVRSEVVSGILEISDETLDAVLAANAEAAPGSYKMHAVHKLSTFRSYVKSAMSSFSAFDRLDGADPNADNLSVDTYRRNERRYSEILSRYINPARDLVREIKSGNFRQPVEEPIHPKPQPPRQPTPRSTDYTPRRSSGTTDFRSSRHRAPAPASPSVVIVETPATPTVIVGGDSSWSRSESYRSSRDEPSYSRPSRSRDDDGGSFTSSSSSDSGSSFSSSSSSDSGGSFDSGSSSSDSGGSSSSSSD